MAHPAPATFLVLSDIHFGELSYVRELQCPNSPPKNVVRNAVNLIDSLVTTVLQMSPRPTAILAPGDLTSVAAPSEFIGCVKVVNNIAERLSIEKANLFFTFGNHDTNWRIAELGKGTERFVADEAYSTVAATVGNSHVKNHDPTESGPVIGSGVFVRGNFVLFVLNSGHACTEAQKYAHGRLGQEQLTWLENMLQKHVASDRWSVMMVHHHPYSYTFPVQMEDISCIEEGAELLTLAGKFGIDFVCHGHRHHPVIFTANRTDWMRPITFLCAGSVAVNEQHRMKGEIPNLFHVLHLDRRLENGGAFGNVKTHRYSNAHGWTSVINDSKYTPIDPIHRFGAIANDIEFQGAVDNAITQAITQSGPLWKPPAFEDLPIALQCCAIKKLNDAFNSCAKKRGFKFLGTYPEETFITK